MIINFSEQTPKGTVEFTGELTPDEVGFLLRYALLSLLSRGMLPATVVATYPEGEDEVFDDSLIPDKDKMN